MWKMRPPAQDKGKVAVIGAGPGGLACAHDLAARGFEVHVYEALSAVGGALYIGIPPYRLPRKYVFDMQRDLEESRKAVARWCRASLSRSGTGAGVLTRSAPRRDAAGSATLPPRPA